jgi:hypothetical protein
MDGVELGAAASIGNLEEILFEKFESRFGLTEVVCVDGCAVVIGILGRFQSNMTYEPCS